MGFVLDTSVFLFGDWLAEKIDIKQEIVIALVCVLLAILMVVLNVRMLGFQYIAYYFAFFAIGYYLHKYEGLLIKNLWVLSFLTMIWGVMAWFWNMHDLPKCLGALPLPGILLQYAYRFSTALIAVYVLICVSPLLLNADTTMNKPFYLLGKVSLGIYVTHLLWISPLTEIIRGVVNDTVLIITIVFIISLAISSFVVWALAKWKVTARLLLGKIKEL